MKVEIAYVSWRGTMGYENLYPEILIQDFANQEFSEIISQLMRSGLPTDTKWISPSAILSVKRRENKNNA